MAFEALLQKKQHTMMILVTPVWKPVNPQQDQQVQQPRFNENSAFRKAFRKREVTPGGA